MNDYSRSWCCLVAAALTLVGCTEPEPTVEVQPAVTSTPAMAAYGTVLQVSAAEVSAAENALAMEVEIRLSPRTESIVTVDYMTVGHTAKVDEDFEFAKGQIKFAPGRDSKTISIVLIDDKDPEDDETFVLRLHASANAVVDNPKVELTIVDDDS